MAAWEPDWICSWMLSTNAYLPSLECSGISCVYLAWVLNRLSWHNLYWQFTTHGYCCYAKEAFTSASVTLACQPEVIIFRRKSYPLPGGAVWREKARQYVFQRRPTADGERNVLIWNLTTKWPNFTHCAFQCTDSLHGQKSLLVPDALFWSYSCGICSAHDWGNWQSSEWGTWCLTRRLNDKEKKISFEVKCGFRTHLLLVARLIQPAVFYNTSVLLLRLQKEGGFQETNTHLVHKPTPISRLLLHTTLHKPVFTPLDQCY